MKKTHQQCKNPKISLPNPSYFSSVQQNNKEIASLLLNSKSGFFNSPRSTPEYPSIISNKTKLEQIINCQTIRNVNFGEKLNKDRNQKLATLTFRQDISHVLDKKPMKKTTRDFFKDRNFSVPGETINSVETPKSFEKEKIKNGFHSNEFTFNKKPKFSNEVTGEIPKIMEKSETISKNSEKHLDNFKESLPSGKNLYDRSLLHSPLSENITMHVRLQTPNYLKTQVDLNSFLAQKVDNNLKKEFPSNQFANPSSRVEVILLLEWLENSIKEITEKEEKKESKSVSERLWRMFEVSYKELERQLLVECNERGKILRKLWDILSELLIKQREENEFVMKKVENAAYDEYNRLHKMYRSQMSLQEENIKKLEHQVKQLNDKNTELQKEKTNTDQRERQFTQKLSENSRILNLYKKKLKIISSENEKLLLKVENSHSPRYHKETHAPHNPEGFFGKYQRIPSENQEEKEQKVTSKEKSHKHIQIKKEDSDKLSEKSSESSVKALEEEFEQSYANLNSVAITSIPEKTRAELYREQSTEIDHVFHELNSKECVTQTELTFMDSLYDKVFVNNKSCMEMAEDFYYKKELEQEELMKYLSAGNKKPNTRSSTTEEINQIRQKLLEYKMRHKNEDNMEREEKKHENISIVEKIRNALYKVRTLKTLEEGHFTRKDDSCNNEELDKMLSKDKDKEKEYETEEEESENEARNDEERQENIINEMENSEENTDRNNKPEGFEENEPKWQENVDIWDKSLEKVEENAENEENMKESIMRPFKKRNFSKEDKNSLENPEITLENLENRKETVEKLNETLERLNESPKSSEDQEKNSSGNSGSHLKLIANTDDNIQHSHKKTFSNPRFQDLKIATKSFEFGETQNQHKKSPSSSSKVQKDAYFMNERSSKESRSINENSRSPSPSIPRNTPTLRKGSRNSVFQINLRHSMEPVVKQRSGTRKSSIFQGSIISNKGRESIVKGTKDQREAILDEIEKTLALGVSEFPPEYEEYNNVFIEYLNKHKDISKEKEGYMRLLIRYKTENKKACTMEDKCKRANEMLEMETMHRTKLEEKHQDLLTNYAILQQELEKCRAREKEMLESQEKEMKASKAISLSSSSEIAIKPHDKQKEGARKPMKERSIKKKLTAIKETVGVSPKLGQKVNLENRNINSGVQLLEKIKARKMRKFENFMHIKLVLKQINLIYSERISNSKENQLSKQLAFANSVYNYFLGLFGLKKIADRRFIIFVLSLKKNNSYFRIAMFSKLFGLYDEKTNYSLEEFNKYIEALDFCLNISTMGVSIVNPESESKFYIPYIRALQYTGLFADTRMSPEENQHLKVEIENLKEPDIKGVNKAGIIDFDLFMERMLSKYRHLVNKAKTYVINAFAASDLDGNKMCNLEEFLLLNRHIEKEKFDKKSLKKVFMENADIDNDGEKNLSFDKFSVLCVEYSLFSDEAQNKYLKITKKSQLETLMEELKITWYGKKFALIESFDTMTVISNEEKENWLKIIEVLEERIMGKNEENHDIKPTLIAYNILIQENEILKEKQEKRNEGIEESQESEEEEEQAQDGESVLKNNDEAESTKKIEETAEDLVDDEEEKA